MTDLKARIGRAEYCARKLEKAEQSGEYGKLDALLKSVKFLVDERLAELQKAQRAKDDEAGIIRHMLQRHSVSLPNGNDAIAECSKS